MSIKYGVFTCNAKHVQLIAKKRLKKYILSEILLKHLTINVIFPIYMMYILYPKLNIFILK